MAEDGDRRRRLPVNSTQSVFTQRRPSARGSVIIHIMNSPNASAGPSRLDPSANDVGSPTPMTHRLYVGNLSPTVDEYTLLQIFSKFGKVTKMDFMFHKTGVQKGKPRGYAFVEFSTKEVRLQANSSCASLTAGRGESHDEAARASPPRTQARRDGRQFRACPRLR